VGEFCVPLLRLSLLQLELIAQAAQEDTWHTCTAHGQETQAAAGQEGLITVHLIMNYSTMKVNTRTTYLYQKVLPLRIVAAGSSSVETYLH
jgi:hypothetical protein